MLGDGCLRIKTQWDRLKLIISRILLLPLLPVLNWGPATHPLINRRALERAQVELSEGNRRINPEIVDRLSRQCSAYIWGGNSADVISVYHFSSGGSSIYDYAHNYSPDHARGIPVFGYRLIDEWQEARSGRRNIVYPEREFAIACGWLSHQLADWYTHYAAIDRDGNLLPDVFTVPDGEYVFPGYASSHRIFGACFLPEILALYSQIDHAILELAHDMLLLADKGRQQNNRVELFNTYYRDGVGYNLLTATSERYQGVAARIPLEHIERLRTEFNLVIRGLHVATELVSHLNPTLLQTLHSSIDPLVIDKPDYISLAVEKVFDHLFCKSFAEISDFARRVDCRPGPRAPKINVREPGRSGTVLFGLLRRIGEYLVPELLLPLVKDGESINVRFLWGLIDVRANFVRHLARHWGSTSIWELAGKLYPDPALWGFISKLLQGELYSLEAPRTEFRRLLQPLVDFEGPPGLSERELLLWMISKGELRVKVVPGIALDRPSPDKELDPDTLQFWINNYPVDELSDFYRLRSGWDGPKLVLNCEIKGSFGPGHHLMYVNAQDRGGIEARSLEREIHFARLQRLGVQAGIDPVPTRCRK